MNDIAVVHNENRALKRSSSPKYQINLGELTKHNLKQLRIVIQCTIPVDYSDTFYKDMLKPDKYCRLAYCNDIIVGSVCYKFDNVKLESGEVVKKAYIMTIGCLVYYRELGVGSKLLRHVMNHCQKLGNIHSIRLHVQTSNDVGLKFYEKHGFKVVQTVPDYYARVTPSSAFELEKLVADCPPLDSDFDSDS